jgi:catechol 2,3-dioxygenase-like lactoylglutathione lyase family enzyme
MPIDATPDHIAVAVPDPDLALRRWHDELGGGFVGTFTNTAFTGRQLRYANGGKLELIGPSPESGPENFLRAFLARFGTRVHHLTLKVPDLHDAVETVHAAGLDVIDIRTESEHWQEGFLRPSQVGGIVVQIAQTPWTDEEWAKVRGQDLDDPALGAASLLGPRLRHPDLDEARRIWTLLGADVGDVAEGLLAAWAGSPLTVLVEEGEPAGPVSLRMTGTSPVAAEKDVNPPIEGAV